MERNDWTVCSLLVIKFNIFTCAIYAFLLWTIMIFSSEFLGLKLEIWGLSNNAKNSLSS